MHIPQNLKHFFAIIFISLISILLAIRVAGGTISSMITHFFVYRENVGFLNILYEYEFEPSIDKIAIITIDEDTINTIQSWSFLKMITLPKSVLTDTLEKLQSVGVRGIAIDIIFQNPDPDEENFATTLRSNTNTVIARMRESGSCRLDADKKYEVCEGIPRSVYADIPQGLIDIDPRIDRKLAKTKDRSVSGEVTYEALALALYNLTSPDSHIDIDEERDIMIPYFGTENTYPMISLSDVLKMSKVDLVKNFAGRYVFIGESGTLIHDAHIAPSSGREMDGVETHAHFLDGLLQGRLLHLFDFASPVYATLFISILIFSLNIYFRFRILISFIYAILGSILMIFLLRFFYFEYGWIIEVLPLSLALIFWTLPITYMYRYFIVDRERNLLAKAFSRYVDPEVVREIREKNVAIELGGESRELTILFSDIAGFTTLSEKTPIKELFLLMSSYLSSMTKILIDRGGTLDKYIGDAIMGFYGAPISIEDHAVRACMTALEMRKALPDFNSSLVARGLDPIDFRVGIATGEVMVGNIGSNDRFNYTVLGDTVNLASRLEATSKEYGTHIIVSEGTYESTKRYFAYRKLDLITVKGKTEPIGIYELIGLAGEDISDAGIYDEYTHALELYVSGQYLEAGTLWESQMHIDPPSRTMALRCVEILKGNLVVDSGVYHMMKK